MNISLDAELSSKNEDDVKAEGTINKGLPPLDLGDKPVSFFEFWPAWVFYVPIVIYWIALSLRYRNFGLPMVVNPNIHLGGMVGESKLEILQMGGELAHQYILPYCEGMLIMADSSTNICDEFLVQFADNEIQRAQTLGVTLPFVIKPELGCRGAGVRVIDSTDALVEYFKGFPIERRYIMQKLAPFSAEAGVFYERMPGAEKGRVTSITLKYRPCVIGDGVSCLKSLILRDPRASILRDLYLQKNVSRLQWVPDEGEEIALGFAGSHCRGSIFRNGNAYISDALSQKIDEIMQDFDEFHYGRLDIKFRDIDTLMDGKDFVIIEVNGVSSEKTHIWDSRTSLWEAVTTLFEQYTSLFKMGARMRAQGFKAPSARELVKTWLYELKQSKEYPSAE